MTGFELPTNYVENHEDLIRRTRAKLKKAPTTSSEINQLRRSLTPESGLLQTERHQIWDLTLNIYNSKDTWPNTTKF
jgi:hypothetical protein